MTFLKNKKHYVYASMAIAIVLSMVLVGTKANALVSPNVGYEKVGIDPDDKRADFEAAATHLDANKSFTSITINTPDEVKNDAIYKDTAIANNTYKAVSTLPDFMAAWRDGKVTYIEVLADLPNTSFSNGERPDGANLIIQGNGNKVDLGTGSLQLSKINTDTSITLNHVEMQENLPISKGDSTIALIRTNGGIGTKLTVNLHDVNVSKGTSSSTNGPVHGVYGVGARVVLSGNSTFEIAGSIARNVGSVEIANDAKVRLTRNALDLFTGEFVFDRLPSGSVSKVNGLRMGDRSINDASQYKGTGTSTASGGDAANSQPVIGKFDIVQTGDEVTWYQNNFGYFIRSSSYDVGDYIFGQNNTIEIPKITNGNALTVGYGKQLIFNAGTVLSLMQAMNVSSSPIQTVGGSIRFISPKSLHIAVQTSNGGTKTGNVLLATSGSPLIITNSSIQAWNGSGSSGSSNPNFTETFRILEADDKGSKINGSGKRKADLFGKDKGTREFKTVALGVGEIKLNYIDQNGNNVGDTTYPLTDGVNFVGQSFNLVTKEFAIDKMPTGYKWAIDEQVYEKAGRGDQGQPGGDNTDADDNGDSFGQANFAIVPMQGETYTYNIYVYSESNPNTTYTYIDPWTGLSFKSDKVTVGSEKVGNYVPAHVGNTIDWTNKLYTETNVPTGYVYVPSRLLPPTMSQPTTTEVKDAVTPSNTIIYVYDPSYKGSLTLSTVPNLDFGAQLISPENRGKLYPVTFSDDLTVTDDRRIVKDGWHLSVQQAAPLTSTDGKTVLRNAIFFREVDGGTLKPLEGGGDLAVYNYVSQAALGVQEIVKPTSNWNKKADGAGFYLKDNGKLKAGDYSTVLTWTLGAGPSQ